MAKSRKDQFESQLRDLQQDINNLSQKLTVPSIVASQRYAKVGDSLDTTSSNMDHHLVDLNRSITSLGSKSYSQIDRGDKLAQLMQEAHLAKKERDDALYRLEQAKIELDEMKKGMQEAARIKVAYEHLVQDYESLKVSLESSERIRKQQKELINLLQRSHTIAAAGDNASVLSFNSLSSISHRGEEPDYGLMPSKDRNMNSAKKEEQPESRAVENRNWLTNTKSSSTKKKKSKHSSDGIKEKSRIIGQKNESKVITQNISNAESSVRSRDALLNLSAHTDAPYQKIYTTGGVDSGTSSNINLTATPQLSSQSQVYRKEENSLSSILQSSSLANYPVRNSLSSTSLSSQPVPNYMSNSIAAAAASQTQLSRNIDSVASSNRQLGRPPRPPMKPGSSSSGTTTANRDLIPSNYYVQPSLQPSSYTQTRAEADHLAQFNRLLNAETIPKLSVSRKSLVTSPKTASGSKSSGSGKRSKTSANNSRPKRSHSAPPVRQTTAVQLRTRVVSSSPNQTRSTFGNASRNLQATEIYFTKKGRKSI